jgi:hypothetical protein
VPADCCPVNCVGNFVVTGNCTGACSGGAGIIPERYNITGEPWAVCNTYPIQFFCLSFNTSARQLYTPAHAAAAVVVSVAQKQGPQWKVSADGDYFQHAGSSQPEHGHYQWQTFHYCCRLLCCWHLFALQNSAKKLWRYILPAWTKRPTANTNTLRQQCCLSAAQLRGVMGGKELLWCLWWWGRAVARGICRHSDCCVQR